jgi:hypothetical protein
MLFNFMIVLIYLIISVSFSDYTYCSSFPSEIDFNNELVSLRNNFRFQLPKELFERKTLDLSIGQQLDGVIDNLAKYEAEKFKFLEIIAKIDNGTELFFPPESKSLFIEYLDLIDVLLEDLRLREYNYLNNLPSLPQPTEEEIMSLHLDSVLLPESQSSFQSEVSFPDQIEFSSSSTIYEEISSLEPEDYMNDAINMGMFNIEKELTPEDYMNDFINLGIFEEEN